LEDPFHKQADNGQPPKDINTLESQISKYEIHRDYIYYRDEPVIITYLDKLYITDFTGYKAD